MGDSSWSLDYWRKFFRTASSDIFELIEKAIIVAAVDCPKEFKCRRDQIAENLFTSQLSKCYGCNRVGVQGSEDGEYVREEECRSVKRELGEKDSKVDSCNCDPEDLSRVGISNYSYDEAEALTEVIEEERQIVGEVLRIKEILCNKQEESDDVLYESLRRLQLMQLSVETLKATEVGRAVNGLRKHNSKQIRNLARTLIDGWKVLVDEWVTAAATIADQSRVNTSVGDEEEGLPSPPMDEGALLVTQTTTIQLSEVFDGMDEDGNFRVSGDFDKTGDAGRMVPESNSPVRTQEPPQKLDITEEKAQMKKQESVVRQEKPHAVPGVPPKPPGVVIRLSKPSTSDSRVVRPSKAAYEQRPCSRLSGVQTVNTPEDKSNHFEEAKLEVAKRKLHEGYRQIENAKKQRTIQVLELHDLPNPSHNQRPLTLKPRNQSRNWAKA
ncbi:hypothetical protein IEQ34_005772 [Dendrobium chrysotoxum]|uniref:TFIIS N-terminal domain-containing protein n=1 Tax=Dendrobium chrysotoxum TaxID=161865 RepID=A0AAV7HC69_DENCH|nr:hypothetical protein IEQ34_005772 [Dendrobium chrysotoxum]